MAVAFDAFTTSAGVDPSFTHTPVGTPRGVLLFVQRLTSEAIASATYGGVSFGSPVATLNNSVGAELTGVTIEAFVLGTSVPSGAQTVALDTGATGATVWVYTVTANGDGEFIDDATIESSALENPSTTLALGGRTCFVAQAWGSGQGAVGGCTPFANWTSRAETDQGSLINGSYSYDVIGSTDVTVGLTQGIDDILLLAVAISDISNDVAIAMTVGSTPMTGRTLGLGLGINMPDVP